MQKDKVDKRVTESVSYVSAIIIIYYEIVKICSRVQNKQ